MEEDRGETGRGRGGGRRDTEAEIGDGPVSQTVSSLLVLNAFASCDSFWMWPLVVNGRTVLTSCRLVCTEATGANLYVHLEIKLGQ